MELGEICRRSGVLPQPFPAEVSLEMGRWRIFGAFFDVYARCNQHAFNPAPSVAEIVRRFGGGRGRRYARGFETAP